MGVTIYGGTFDPPHIGHKRAKQILLSRGHTVIVVPSIGHEFKPESLKTYLHRKEMTRRAFGEIMCPIEEEILRSTPMPIKAIDMLQFMKKTLELERVSFAIGPDVDVTKWTGIEDIMAGPFEFVNIPDTGNPRSTMIRNLIKKGEPWEHLVEEEVAEYIKLHKLYL